MARHINIPIFIPHEGCPNDCVFCNQHTITGQTEKADRDIKTEIDTALSTYEGKAEDAEIAFFGGSFTGIERSLMVRLLDQAFEYVKCGKVSSIRLSTRPDYIDEEILQILKERGVTNIELGIQSMSDKVLSASKRGHTAEASEKACRLIKEYGFTLTGQMMIGLPSSLPEDELFTANEIVRLGCDSTRIYPTVVFEETELCRMAKIGAYKPISVEEAIERSAVVYEVFVRHGVKVLRIGLQATEALISGDGIYAGANHSALGELIVGEYYYRLMKKEVFCLTLPQSIDTFVIKCACGEQSKVSGQKKNNKIRLAEDFKSAGINVKNIKIEADKTVLPNKLEYVFNI